MGSIGPLSVHINMSDDLRHYTSGVYESTKCQKDQKSQNLSLLAVGYGYDELSGR